MVLFSIMVYIWDRYPQFFRGRLRVLYDLTGEIPNSARPKLAFYEACRRARIDDMNCDPAVFLTASEFAQ